MSTIKFHLNMKDRVEIPEAKLNQLLGRSVPVRVAGARVGTGRVTSVKQNGATLEFEADIPDFLSALVGPDILGKDFSIGK